MKRLSSWLVVLGVVVAQTVGIVPKVYAAGSATITGHATIDSYTADAMSVCFYPWDGTGSSQCSSVDTSGNYSITLGDTTPYSIDLVGSVGTFQFRSSDLYMATAQSGTLNVTVHTKSLHVSLIDVFGRPVSGANTTITTFAKSPVNNYSNITYSASGLSLVENMANYSASSDSAVTDSQGRASYIGLSNFVYSGAVEPPVGSYYQPAGLMQPSDADTWTSYVPYPYITDLSSTSDLITNGQPHIFWQSVANAASYAVYRKPISDTSYPSDTDIIATTTNTDYLDQTNLTEGYYIYYVAALNGNGDTIAFSHNASEATIDRTLPTISGLTMKKKVGAKPVVIDVASVADSLSGIVAGEFYVDSDPGQGSGVPMTIIGTAPNNLGMTATHTFTGLTKGGHVLFARTMDQAGNWSQTAQVNFNF